MALDFPTSPSLNQIYTYGGRSWIWNGVAWDSYSSSSGLTQYVSGINGLSGAVNLAGGSSISVTPAGNTLTISYTGSGGGGGGFTFYYQSTAPSSPSVGTRWINSDTGIEFVYINDGNSSQWIQPTYSGIQGPAGPAGPTGPSGPTGATGSGGGGGSTTKTEINPQTGTSYTTVLSDAGKLITLSNTSAITLTIPADSSVAYDQGTLLYFAQLNTGNVGITGAAGVTVVATPGLYLRTQYSSASAIKLNTDYWIVSGDLSA